MERIVRQLGKLILRQVEPFQAAETTKSVRLNSGQLVITEQQGFQTIEARERAHFYTQYVFGDEAYDTGLACVGHQLKQCLSVQ